MELRENISSYLQETLTATGGEYGRPWRGDVAKPELLYVGNSAKHRISGARNVRPSTEIIATNVGATTFFSTLTPISRVYFVTCSVFCVCAYKLPAG